MNGPTVHDVAKTAEVKSRYFADIEPVTNGDLDSTDQFPNSPSEAALAYYEILMAGGFTTGGPNFDAKLRRQSHDAYDLIAPHVGGMDICARRLKAAHAMITNDAPEAPHRAS